MPSNKHWSDAELSVAVETYIYLLRLERNGIVYSERELNAFLSRDSLKNRNEASIRYRLRNLSAVFRAHGWPTLRRYSPAERVGSGVRERIEEILEARRSANADLLRPQRGPRSERAHASAGKLKGDAISRLNELRLALQELRRSPNIGHNKPPEPIDESFPPAEEGENAEALVRELANEIGKSKPSAKKIERNQQRLMEFGLKTASWVGARATKFSDAALATLASIAVAKFTNALPLIVEAVVAVTRYLQHLI
jgi:hypothetical protein